MEKTDTIKVTEDQLKIIDSTELLELNDNLFIRKERCLQILQKWTDKIKIETVEPLQSRIAELELIISENTVRIIGHMDYIKDLEEKNSALRKKIENFHQYCDRNGIPRI